ncbi:hypothetical protein ACRALDRAFT_1061517 [Sodiomyces alcalophilus JCM 7366]|uniref:uncharacterized protein n=1 Tax=Sodiomyces alcalophilus JCM 7366 TaxID=591952 RepID=UPI0039B4B8E2
MDVAPRDSTSSAVRPAARTASQSQAHSAASGSTSTGSPSVASVASSAAATTGATAQSPTSKRRRGLGVVTPNACTECRKKRAKCDGQKPCGRCRSQKDVRCIYEVPVRQSKDELRTELGQLRQRQRASNQVFNALAQSDAWEEILRRLRGGQSVDSISEWLDATLPSGGGAMPSFAAAGAGASPMGHVARFTTAASARPPIATMGLGATAVATLDPMHAQQSGIPPQNMNQTGAWHFPTTATRDTCQGDPMNWSIDLNRPPQGRVGFWGNALNTDQSDGTYRGLDQVLGLSSGIQTTTTPTTWTSITTDAFLVQHLLALYFCWEYPAFASLSKEHFLQDFQEGRPRFCSSMLVNALLALGCRFSTKPSTRTDPNDPYTSGDPFFKECQNLLYLEEDHHSLTTIQALGIMSIREASCGRDAESWHYAGQSIRLAIEMGLHQVQTDGTADEDELAVRAATFWGAFALDHAWSLATGSLPQSSCFPHLPPKPAVIGDIEASLWIPYTDDGAPLQRSAEQPSNVRSVYRCFCELSELVHQSLYVLHSPWRPLTSRDLLNIYTQYLNWYDQIPEVLRLGHNFTPAVLFTHMYYHFAILLMFRPLIKLRIIGSKVLPRDVCFQAADAIQGLLRSHAQLYTLRRTPSFVPYFVLTSSIMHLALGASARSSQKGPGGLSEPSAGGKQAVDPRVAKAIRQGVDDLKEMSPCHYFAEQALNILRYLARSWNIDVDMGDEPSPPDKHKGKAGLYTSSLNFFAPNVREEDFLCARGQDGTGQRAAESDAQRVAETAGTMENPIFWPFPMQGRPILPSGPELAEAGFEVI